MFVYLTRQAERDFDQIVEYVAARNQSAAIRLGEQIREAFLVLERYGAERAWRPDPNLRTFSVRKYVIYYRVLADKIEVARIVHGSRDQRSALNEPE